MDPPLPIFGFLPNIGPQELQMFTIGRCEGCLMVFRAFRGAVLSISNNFLLSIVDCRFSFLAVLLVIVSHSGDSSWASAMGIEVSRKCMPLGN